VKHGACLGIGLAAMGTARQDIYDELKNNLHQDDAVTGEASGIAIGLVMLGTNSSQALQDMLAVSFLYNSHTKHCLCP
jgi:26S proteasome regulatory subunit N2